MVLVVVEGGHSMALGVELVHVGAQVLQAVVEVEVVLVVVERRGALALSIILVDMCSEVLETVVEVEVVLIVVECGHSLALGVELVHVGAEVHEGVMAHGRGIAIGGCDIDWTKIIKLKDGSRARFSHHGCSAR